MSMKVLVAVVLAVCIGITSAMADTIKKLTVATGGKINKFPE